MSIIQKKRSINVRVQAHIYSLISVNVNGFLPTGKKDTDYGMLINNNKTLCKI